MAEAKHTPGPYNVGEDNDIFAYTGSSCIAQIVGGPEGNRDAVKTAEFIVRACNSHNELVGVLEYAEKAFADTAKRNGCCDYAMAHDARTMIKAALANTKATG